MFRRFVGEAYIVEKVLLWMVAIIVIVDIYLYLNKEEGDTISNILKKWVHKEYFFITYLWGVLAGHFFLGTKKPPFDSTLKSVGIVLMIALLMFILGRFFKQRVQPMGQVALFVVGLLIGHFFWSLYEIPKV